MPAAEGYKRGELRVTNPGPRVVDDQPGKSRDPFQSDDYPSSSPHNQYSDSSYLGKPWSVAAVPHETARPEHNQEKGLAPAPGLATVLAASQADTPAKKRKAPTKKTPAKDAAVKDNDADDDFEAAATPTKKARARAKPKPKAKTAAVVKDKDTSSEEKEKAVNDTPVKVASD
ncbi:hypothetical protein CONLIGDRAFT_646699 [Coniochaeta ligniaria NRRL 30616]|uniref:Uncharacterized protein n=1 Tax=Coniochaeta ligniaria NRRL 30616 TaxID=1408157 RepID=A0A1J7JBE3_9PEZI|nr:hypothetical protein CONLIGDRAFT_646699 [Coniochaeta ligniaria NRRL 30616]